MTEPTIEWDLSECSVPSLSPVCVLCRHWRVREGRTCDAFPERDSIPLAIWLGENDHRAPIPGDHGIRFEPVDAEADRPRSVDHLPTR